MASWFLRGLRRGIVTTKYPAGSEPWAAGLPTPPVFDERRMTGALAEELVKACPSRALAREGGYLVLDLGACTSCGRCLAVAGEAARPSGVFELAATRPIALRKCIALTDEGEGQ